MRAAVVVGLAVALLAGPACDQYRTAPLVRKWPVHGFRPVSESQMEWAIEAGLAARQWEIVSRAPGRYVARLHERVHDVTVEINYGDRDFSIDYVDSKNLFYAKDPYYAQGEFIHRKYMTWVKVLGNEIKQRLAEGRFQDRERDEPKRERPEPAAAATAAAATTEPPPAASPDAGTRP